MNTMPQTKFSFLLWMGTTFLFTSVTGASAKEQAIWFQQPAQNWNEALPLGNSRHWATSQSGRWKAASDTASNLARRSSISSRPVGADGRK